MALYALVDCNNFYASCERVINPRLAKKPIVILSNNDGCIVARSNEAKSLGIPMGAPFFQWRDFCQKKGVHVFSSNYELYGDMSSRVMSILSNHFYHTEIYSIDEAFLHLSQTECSDPNAVMLSIRNKILTWTGIPVSIGIAPTKTLAKIANHVAKKISGAGIFDIRDTENRDSILNSLPVSDIWGIGRKLSARLESDAIFTAAMLRDSHAPLMRKKHGIMMERTIFELRGTPCFTANPPAHNKQIISSRSFGRPIFQLNELEEAVSHYTARACEKLRRQHSIASAILVFIRTGLFDPRHPPYEKSAVFTFSQPSSESSVFIHGAKKILHNIFKTGHAYKKAGVILMDITPAGTQQIDFLCSNSNQKSIILSKTMDSINKKMGRGTLVICAEGITQPWKMKNTMQSESCTTQWKKLPEVFCK